MPGEARNFDQLRAAVAATNPDDNQIREALREILEALTRGGRIQPFLRLNSAGAPTDILVQAADAEGHTEREVFDGQAVAVRSSGKFQIYVRDAGSWIAVDDA